MKKYHKIWLPFFSLIGVAICDAQLLQTSLEIANPNPVGSGARAMGQANAFIAIADDATAASWNPGGLSQLERPEFSFALESIYRRDRLNSENGRTESLDLQDFNFASVVLPFFYLDRNMVFSLNYLKQFRFDREYTLPLSTKVGNFDVDSDYVFDQEGDLSVIAAALGVDVTPKLYLGVTLNLWHDSLTQSSHFTKNETQTEADLLLNGAPIGATLPPVVEVNRFEVEEGYSFVIGAMYRLSKAWAFGAVIKPAFTLDFDHERTVTEFNAGVPNQLEDIDQNAELEFPLIIGVGTAWRPNDELTVSGDVTWAQWSEYRFEEGGVNNNPITSTRNQLRDTFTVRVGMEYLLILKENLIPLRCGLAYDPAPAVGEVDDYYTVNLGVGVQIKNRVNLDIAYEFRWGNDVNGDSLQGFNATQDIRRHRILASLIWYF